MRNIEVLRDYFFGRDPQLKETLADNSLRLIGIPGREFALMIDVRRLLKQLSDLMEKSDLELAGLINDLSNTLDAHRNNTVIHLSPQQIQMIEDAVTPQELTDALNNALSNYYTKAEVDSLFSAGLKRKIVPSLPISNIDPNTIYMVPKQGSAGDVYNEYMYINGSWELIGGTDVDLQNYYTKSEINAMLPQNTAEVIEDVTEEPTKVINAEWFYRFKNLVDNSSFEVFDGQTLVPYGWTGATVSAEASMFGTYSMKIEQGDTAQVVSKNQPDVTWAQSAYDSDSLILSFYHKFGGVQVSVYDIVNQQYMDLQKLDNYLEPVGSPMQVIQFPYKENWNRYRGYVVITPEPTTRKIRLEFYCPTTGTREVYIDGVSLEPYEEGEYPSIYKDGRYAISAYQVLNPPPGDADRFTLLEHFSIGNCTVDPKGNLTKQELLRADGTLAIKREASNPDANDNYQTIVETFYKADGVTVNYVDTYTFAYSSSGAIISKTMTTTEV